MNGYLIPEEFKLLRDDKFVMENVEKIVLENTEDNHYKFYHMSRKDNQKDSFSPYLNGRQFTASWGRIGTEKTVTGGRRKDYNLKYGMAEQMAAKLKKGYKIKTYQVFGEHSIAYQEFMELIGGECELFD